MENKEFLQSEEWREFQENFGRKTYRITGENFSVSIVEHTLSVVGKYLYAPRGPIFEIMNYESGIKDDFNELINLAKKEKAGWIRFDVENSHILDIIRDNWRIVKAPHDMQPRENFVIDIRKSEEELLSEMKSKTRYNIKLAEKKGVKVISNFQFPISNEIQNSNDKNNKYYVDKFVELVELTAKRKGISFHPGDYYRKMVESLPIDMISLYIAEYNRKCIAANLVVFYGDTAIYLHGATDDEYRNVMAPYLLQWQAILDAKKAGCKFYDMGGVRMVQSSKLKVKSNGWAGITKFKLGFSQITRPVEFLGSYDIIVSPIKYWAYRLMQKVKSFVR